MDDSRVMFFAGKGESSRRRGLQGAFSAAEVLSGIPVVGVVGFLDDPFGGVVLLLLAGSGMVEVEVGVAASCGGVADVDDAVIVGGHG